MKYNNNKTKKKKGLIINNQESNSLKTPNYIKSKKIYRNRHKNYFNNLLKNRKFLFILFILFIFSILLYILINIFKLVKYKLKVCLCTLGKQENRYINEFVDIIKNMELIKFIYMIIMMKMDKNSKM